MEIAGSIYKVVVRPSYKKTTWADANCTGHIRKRVDKLPRHGLALIRARSPESALKNM